MWINDFGSLNRPTHYDYDNLNRVKSEQWLSGGKTFTYAYDQNSNLTSADADRQPNKISIIKAK